MKGKICLAIIVILFGLGIFMLMHGDAGLSLQTKDGYDQTEDFGRETDFSFSLLSELGKDFKTFLTIGADLFHVISGGESQFNNGLAVLTGNEAIDNSGGPVPPDIDNHDTSNQEKTTPTVAELMAGDGADTPVQLVEASVESVVDGDTFYAVIGNADLKIRLIGVDTPESVHADDSKNTVWGTYASDYTKTILKEGMTVYLEYDEEPTDKYGRTLAYVWLSEDTSDLGNMLNAILVRDGYAYDKVFRPNVKYADLFEELRVSAQNSGAGLWADEGFAALWEG